MTDESPQTPPEENEEETIQFPLDELSEMSPTHETAVEPTGDFDSEPAATPPEASINTLAVWLVGAVIGSLLGMIVFFVVEAWTIGFLPWQMPFALAVCIFLGCLWYARSILYRHRELQPTALQLAVPANPAYTWVDEQALYRIRHALSVDQSMPEASEQRIHIVFRRHKMYAIRLCFLPASILVAYLVLSAWLAIVTNIEHTIPAFLWVCILVALLAWLYLRFREWQDWFFVMTDKNIILLKVHPEWLWWRKGKNQRLPVKDVRFVEANDMSALGNSLGYGTLLVDGLTRLDVDYNDIRYTPRHHTVGKFAMMMVNGS